MLETQIKGVLEGVLEIQINGVLEVVLETQIKGVLVGVNEDCFYFAQKEIM